MKLQFHFRSWKEEDRANTGGYTFPILDTFGDYSISIFSMPENPEEYDWLKQYIGQSKTILSYVDDQKVVIVRGGVSLKDMGLSILTAENMVGKTIKRAKTLARPFRIYARLPHGLRVKFVEGGPELDGAFVVSREVYNQALENLSIPGWHPVQRSAMIRAMDRQLIHNFRGVGYHIDVDTGEEVKGFSKGNIIVSDSMPEGVDMMMSRDNFKPEFVANGTTMAWAMFEPQGAKDAWEDQQTVINMPFLLSVPEARKRMKESTMEYLDRLTKGEILNSVEELSRAEFDKDYAYDSDTFARLLRWHANKWALHGLSYLLSPWLTQRLGISFIKSFAIDDQRKIRIPIPGAVRAQVVTESLVKLAGRNVQVPPGEITWVKGLNVAVVNDAHWIHQLIPSHGGCDLDDFFVLRRNGEKCIITRSPNARGEYTEFDQVIRWWPGSEKARPLTRKTRPTQILDAIGAGEVNYLPLPSETDPPVVGEIRDYRPQDTIAAIDEALSVEGGYGQYELAVRAYNSLTLAKHPSQAIASEDAVDAFTQGGTADDRNFILADRERIIEEIIASGKAVDTLLVHRLGRDLGIPEDTEGPLVHFKRVQMEAEKTFMGKLEFFTDSLPIPKFLEQLGNSPLLEQATQMLRQSRRAMFQADRAGENIRAAQEAAIIPLIEGIESDYERHLFVVTFWYACRTVPTSRGKITDQPVFGTSVLDHLLEALIYFGIAQEPRLDDMGHIVRDRKVMFDPETGTWTLTCQNCGTAYQNVGAAGLRGFHSHNGLCKNCRD